MGGDFMLDYNRDGVIDDLDEHDYWDDIYYEEDMEDFNNKFANYSGNRKDKSNMSPHKGEKKEKFWVRGFFSTILLMFVIIVLLIISLPLVVACPPLGLMVLAPIWIPLSKHL